MRIDARSGLSAGNRSAISCARSQLTRAAARSRLVDQVAARMCQEYASRRSPAASRCSAINAAFASAVAGSPDSIAAAKRRCNSRDRTSAALRRPPCGSTDGETRTPRPGCGRARRSCTRCGAPSRESPHSLSVHHLRIVRPRAGRALQPPSYSADFLAFEDLADHRLERGFAIFLRDVHEQAQWDSGPRRND
jgi:hypothetical protein